MLFHRGVAVRTKSTCMECIDIERTAFGKGVSMPRDGVTSAEQFGVSSRHLTSRYARFDCITH